MLSSFKKLIDRLFVEITLRWCGKLEEPVELVERAIMNSSQRRGIVLDPFGGSGTTLIACEQLGRRCFAVELDPAYCDVIRQRYAEYTRGH